MSDVQKAIDVLHDVIAEGTPVGDQIVDIDESERWAMEYAISALTLIANRRSEIAALFDEVREMEHERLQTIYLSEKADEQEAARIGLARAFAELKKRDLLIYYKLYDFAQIVNGDADKILDLAAI